MFLKSFIASAVVATGFLSTSTAVVAETPSLKVPDIAEMLKRKMLLKPSRRYSRKVFGRARLSRELKADLVVLSVGIKANGGDAGKAVLALESKKNSVLEAIKLAGFDVANAEVSGLRVHNRRRTQYVDGQRKTVRSFEGSMSIEFIFKASENVLGDVAKITGDRVTGINSMRFKFSKQAWSSAVTELKAQALDKATQDAKSKAERQNRSLGVLVRKTVNDPYNRTSRGTSKRTVLVQVNARVTYQTK